ncbi:MAG: TRAP transporter small permease subunit [Sneathiellales bacterium]|nr:TRAP transporter small permease subunit [Sneathiellales bacterium]
MSGISAGIVTFSDRLNRLLNGMALLCLGLMVLFVIIQVVARYVFASPPPWTEEGARYAMVWLGLLGATMSFKTRLDPSLVKLSVSLPPGVQAVAALLRSISVLMFLLPILWYSLIGLKMDFSRSFLMRHWYLEAHTFEISTFWVAIAVPIFAATVLVHGLARSARMTTSCTLETKENE